MDPLLDEKLVIALLRIASEHFSYSLHLHAAQEAYGPSRNEGLCYENCSRIDISGDLNASLFVCMDGYARMKLLPRIAEKYNIDPAIQGMAASVLLEFAGQFGAGFLSELLQGGFNVTMSAPENLDHKLIPIDLERYRQYIMIFFLRDRRIKQYIGRMYLILTIRKY